MLRSVLVVLGAVLSIVGGALLATGSPGGVPCLIVGLLVVMGTLFEQIIYKPVGSRAPGLGWVRTTERFVDPQTGKTVTVYEQPATGERTYVNE